ncbi:hypothetical protein BKA80DRAFT_283193 [Phyllosticta citrichinensis]
MSPVYHLASLICQRCRCCITRHLTRFLLLHLPLLIPVVPTTKHQKAQKKKQTKHCTQLSYLAKVSWCFPTSFPPLLFCVFPCTRGGIALRYIIRPPISLTLPTVADGQIHCDCFSYCYLPDTLPVAHARTHASIDTYLRRLVTST